MTHLLRFKWFYGTLGFWFLLSSLSGWALILAPRSINWKKISEFTTQLNGITAQNGIFSSSATSASLESISKAWAEKGWIRVAAKTNLSSVLLDAPAPYSRAVESLVQISVFQKADQLRLLGLLPSPAEGLTYQWIAEIPKKALQPQNPAHLPFPLKPPREASDILSLGAGHPTFLRWSTTAQNKSILSFEENYRAQGFTGKRLQSRSGDAGYLLEKGTTQLLGIIPRDSNFFVVYLMK